MHLIQNVLPYAGEVFIKCSSEGKYLEGNETLKAFRKCILMDWFLVSLSFQLRLVSMTRLHWVRLNKLSYLQLQDWHKRYFPPFLLPQQSHTSAGKWPLWQNADGQLAVQSPNTRLAFQKNGGASGKACKSSQKYQQVCSSPYSYKKRHSE